MWRHVFLLLVTGLVGTVARAEPQVEKAEEARFAKLVDTYFAEYTAMYPAVATELGVHEHDRDLEDVTPAGLARQAAWLRGWEAKLAEVKAEHLGPVSAMDWRVLQQAVGRARFNLGEVQQQRRLPDYYVRLCSGAVYGLIKRDFAPAAQRLQLVVEREEKLPGVLKAAEGNLDQMAPVSVDIALDDLEGTVGFFERDVPQAFAGVKDAALQERLRRSTAAVRSALGAYGDFLRGPGRARATAKFALGEALFVKKLHWDEMIDTPLPELLSRGQAELSRLQEEFRRTAARIDPKLTPAQVHEALWRDHPAAVAVIPETQARLDVQQRFLKDRDLVGLPSDRLPRVKETPPFLRATTLASMDTPGPFERSATEAYYNVTLPDPAWPPGKVEDYLQGAFNRPLIDVVTIHEALPGHYIQYLWLNRLSKVRQFTCVGSNEEGWAHYTEQMMLDEGFGGGDQRLRLAQLQDALLRAARYVVAIRLHTQGMTVEQAADFFQKEGLQTRQVSEVEAKRGTQDPMYLHYTWGKLEIMRLREAYKKRLGAAYTLRKFHDAFLAQGQLSLPLLWEALLGSGSGKS